MELIEKEELPAKNYLSLSTLELLGEFGSGRHIPGSGSASTLSALLGIEMMKTVLKLTLDKPEYRNVHDQFRFILKDIEENFRPQLIKLFNDDITEFHKVSYHRRQRDIAKEAGDESLRSDHAGKAIEQLRICTEIPLEVCKLSFRLLDYAFSIYDHGFKSARGDAGVGISNILAAVSGSLFVTFLNLKTFRGSDWKTKVAAEANRLAIQFSERQRESFERVVNLYNEGSSNSEQLTLPF